MSDVVSGRLWESLMWIASPGEGGREGKRNEGEGERGPVETKFLDIRITIIRLKTKHLISLPATQRVHWQTTNNITITLTHTYHNIKKNSI